MITKKHFFTGLTIAVTSLISCKKDKENPVITIETPAEHSNHLWGSEVHLNATFTDDQGLKSYEVLLGNEAGDHDHMFDFHLMGDISGTSHALHEHFMVPDSAEMMRWLHFTVTDMEDKTTAKTWMLHFDE